MAAKLRMCWELCAKKYIVGGQESLLVPQQEGPEMSAALLNTLEH